MPDVNIEVEVAEIEKEINRTLGGEAVIGDIIAILLERGWSPPQQETSPDHQ